jgi:short-subunit dehydrogenase
MNSKWAIVTGASSGIGKALALEFAAHSFNILLIARNQAALAQTAEECARNGVETDIIATDLSEEVSLERLNSDVASSDRRYEVLVNNAGFGIHGDFASTDIHENLQLVNVQLAAALTLTRAVLPGMISRHSGRILNVASVYSFSPVPFQSVYAACKAFLLSFSSALENELKETGVMVTVFCPGATQTEFRSRAGIRQKRADSGMSAESAARIAYLETMRGKRVVIPGLLNRIFVLLTQLIPDAAVPGVVRFINRQRGQTHSQPSPSGRGREA